VKKVLLVVFGLALIFLCFVIVGGVIEYASIAISSHQNADGLGLSFAQRVQLQRALSIYEIWKCDKDGGYELRTSITQIGKYSSVGEAQAAMTNDALQLLHYEETYENDMPPRLPDCGKRLQ
jgi:hypothetical protein